VLKREREEKRREEKRKEKKRREEKRREEKKCVFFHLFSNSILSK
jgi:hypothetical protein